MTNFAENNVECGNKLNTLSSDVNVLQKGFKHTFSYGQTYINMYNTYCLITIDFNNKSCLFVMIWLQFIDIFWCLKE